ncbi:MAG: hypothetical protein ABL932_01400 [Terricaulis sp.]
MVRLRQFAKLDYGNPHRFLRELRKFEYTVAASDTALRLKTLRTNGLKREREMRDAALFCVGMSHNLGTEVLFAPVEDQDYDFVATWRTDATQHFCPVQLKEVVPTHLNPTASIQDVIGMLSHYGDSTDVSVAIKFNQIGRFERAGVNPPNRLQIGGLWVFGAVTEDQSMWALWGDFMQTGPSTLGICYPCPIEQAQL